MLTGKEKDFKDERVFSKFINNKKELQKINDLDIDKQDEDGNTPLHASVMYNNEISIAILSRLKCNINKVNNKNETACMLATKKNSIRCLHVLCSYGADIDIKDENGKTPMKVSIDLEYEGCSHVLVEHGADISMKYVYIQRESEDEWAFDEFGFIKNRAKIKRRNKERERLQKWEKMLLQTSYEDLHIKVI
jgi:ankyrin repeat protein